MLELITVYTVNLCSLKRLQEQSRKVPTCWMTTRYEILEPEEDCLAESWVKSHSNWSCIWSVLSIIQPSHTQHSSTFPMCSCSLHPTPLSAPSCEDSFAFTCPVLTQLLPHTGTPTVDKGLSDDISFLYQGRGMVHFVGMEIKAHIQSKRSGGAWGVCVCVSLSRLHLHAGTHRLLPQENCFLCLTKVKWYDFFFQKYWDIVTWYRDYSDVAVEVDGWFLSLFVCLFFLP